MFIHIEIVKTEHYQREKNENKKKLNNNGQKSTAPGTPRRSPIQVLTGLDVA